MRRIRGKSAEMSFVHFTRLLVLLWRSLSELSGADKWHTKQANKSFLLPRFRKRSAVTTFVSERSHSIFSQTQDTGCQEEEQTLCRHKLHWICLKGSPRHCPPTSRTSHLLGPTNLVGPSRWEVREACMYVYNVCMLNVCMYVGVWVRRCACMYRHVHLHVFTSVTGSNLLSEKVSWFFELSQNLIVSVLGSLVVCAG